MVRAEPTLRLAAEPTAAHSVSDGALVLGAEYRALGVVRSLGRRGLRVWVLKDSDDILAALSRYTERALDFPTGSDDRRAQFLLELAEQHGLKGWTLFPSGDETAAFVAREHKRLSQSFALTTPPWDTFKWAYDKRLMHELAGTLGIDQPKTSFPAGPEQLESIDIDFPCILKPAVKPEFNRLTAAKAWLVRDREELASRYAEACRLMAAEQLMVQQLIPGDGEHQLSFAALCIDGEPVATAIARRTRQYPPDFGRASTFVETVDSPEVVGPSLRLLRKLRFDGLVEVEYKRDPRTAKLLLLDINPRVWGWHTLCGHAGVDFPYLAAQVAGGRRPTPTCTRPGARWVRTSTDLPTSVREILGRRLSLRAYLRSLRRPRETAIFARDDVVPGLAEIPLMLRVLVRRLARGNGI